MKKVEKFLKHISKLETGSAPSVEYFEQIILEAREALEEFEQLRQYNVVGRSEQLPPNSITYKEHKDLMKALYPKDNSKRFRR